MNVIGYGLLGIPETGEVEGHIYTPCMKESWRARRRAKEKQRRQRIQVTHHLTHGAEERRQEKYVSTVRVLLRTRSSGTIWRYLVVKFGSA